MDSFGSRKGYHGGGGGIKITFGAVLAVLLIIGAYWYGSNAGKSVNIPLNTVSGNYHTAMSLSSITSGVTLNKDDLDNQVLTVTKSQLNLQSSNYTQISFTLNLDRSDGTSDANSAYPVYVIKPFVQFTPQGSSGTSMRPYVGYSNVSSTFYTVQFDPVGLLYNTTVAGKTIQLSNAGVGQGVQQGTTLASVVTVSLDGYTNYNSDLLRNTNDMTSLAKFGVYNPNGQLEHTVTVRYIK